MTLKDIKVGDEVAILCDGATLHIDPVVKATSRFIQTPVRGHPGAVHSWLRSSGRACNVDRGDPWRIEPATDEHRRLAAHAGKLRRIRATDWSGVPEDVLDAVIAIIKKVETP